MIYTRIMQGTTPYLSFPSSLDITKIQKLKVSFSQEGKLILTKGLDECYFRVDRNQIVIPLSQEETYMFDEKKGHIQVIIRLGINSESITAQSYEVGVINIEDKEVL